jgi:hypothetical protein
MEDYSVAEVAETVSDALEGLGEIDGMGVYRGEKALTGLTRDPWMPIIEAPEKAWFFLVGTDGRKFAVTITEVPEGQ